MRRRKYILTDDLRSNSHPDVSCPLPTSLLTKTDFNDLQMHNKDDNSNYFEEKDPDETKRRELCQYASFQLHIQLKHGTDLVARDNCGTSDPYVKFKVNGKLVYKSKTVYKELNPTWDESFTTEIDDIFEPVIIKVFDYDWGLKDDFMGMAHLDLTAVDLNTKVDKTIYLIEPKKETPEGSMGSLQLSVSIVPRTKEEKFQYQQQGVTQLRGQQKCPKRQIWSNSHSKISCEHQDSGAEYGADQSSCATPLNISPLRGSLHSQARQQSQDLGCDVTGLETSHCSLPTSPLNQRNSNELRTHNKDDNSNYFEEKDHDETRRRELHQYASFQLHIQLKHGTDLVARDTCGTSDPYVKFKVNDKLVYKSKTVYKELNPTWDESFTTEIDDIFEPVIIKVFDYDLGFQDDLMGMAHLDLTTVDLNTTVDKTIYLREPKKETPGGSMGSLQLSVSIVPRTQEEKDQYLQRGETRLVEQQKCLKRQVWSSVVTIVLVEGNNLRAMDPNGFSDPYVKFRLGSEKYISKVELQTLTPKWLEQVDFHLFEDQNHILEITLFDKDVINKDDFMGKCSIDLREFEREITHQIWAPLENDAGSLFLLLTISGTTGVETITDTLIQNEELQVERSSRYKLTNSFHNMKDVGYLKVKVFRAQGLMSADIGGKSDPFCVLELVNARLQTQTEYKTLAPTWNKIFNFNVKDIHSVLEVTVYDADRAHKVEFLGKVAIPLLKIKNGEKKWYALKDKKLRIRAKGTSPEILLECSIHWNFIRAAVRTLNPKEEKYMQPEQNFKTQVFIRNVNRLKAVLLDFIEIGKFINDPVQYFWNGERSCQESEAPLRSMVAFVLFMIITYCFETYMIPIVLLLVFLRNYIMFSLVGSLMHRDEKADFSGDEEDMDDGDKLSEKKKYLKEHLQGIQDVRALVQNAIGFIASLCERCKNTFNFTVPFLSWLLILALILGTLVLYYIPVRYLVMLWGINKFARKLNWPHAIVHNYILDFLSRVPDDEEIVSHSTLIVPKNH